MDVFFLGVDTGSSVCKASFIDASRQVAVVAEQAPLLHLPPGWVEADPGEASVIPLFAPEGQRL